MTRKQQSKKVKPAPQFTVVMHRDLVDELDYGFSPLDGIVAIGQMFGELPLLHPADAPKHPWVRAPRNLRVYRGRYHWYPNLCFSYVQIDRTLQVLELWWDDRGGKYNRVKVDVVLGKNPNFQAVQECCPVPVAPIGEN
jgi:hypothetical protein